MQYEQLIREAWRIVWQHKFLWWLALWAGSASTFVSSGGLRPDELAEPIQEAMTSASPELRQAAPNALRWIGENSALVMGGALVLAIILLLMIIFSCVFKAALVRGTLDLALHQDATPGRSWSAGFAYLWRFVSLSLIFGLLVAAMAVCIVGIISLVSVLSAGGNAIGPALGALLALPITVGSVVLAVIASIVFPFAEREVVHHNLGPVDALWAGWRLLRTRIKQSLLVWFIGMVIAVAAGVVVGMGFIIAGFVLFIPGALLWWLAGPGAIAYGFTILAAAVLTAVIFGMSAVSNAYQWTYWSLVYVRLIEGGATAAAAEQGQPA